MASEFNFRFLQFTFLSIMTNHAYALKRHSQFVTLQFLLSIKFIISTGIKSRLKSEADYLGCITTSFRHRGTNLACQISSGKLTETCKALFPLNIANTLSIHP